MIRLEISGDIINNLISWWRSTDRKSKYPWRTDRDPYRSIVTEVLLTRTKREIVARIYQEFFSKFPDAKSLSQARDDEILKIISCLGLRKRVRTLKMLAEKLTSKLPEKPEDLEDLPGIGRYAIDLLSLKLFGKGKLPADRNIARVVWRLFKGCDPDSEKPENDKFVRDVLATLEYPNDPDATLEVAYALMDLGHEICKPRKPRCRDCPLMNYCLYQANQLEERKS